MAKKGLQKVPLYLITKKKLFPYKGTIILKLIYIYQKQIGLLLYVAVII